jgi:CheY-like chemotaxis protein
MMNPDYSVTEQYNFNKAKGNKYNSIKVIIADDEPYNSKILSLKMSNTIPISNIITCLDGEDAIRLYKEEPRKIALVILDGIMKKIGGYDAAKQIRQAADEFNLTTPKLVCKSTFLNKISVYRLSDNREN